MARAHFIDFQFRFAKSWVMVFVSPKIGFDSYLQLRATGRGNLTWVTWGQIEPIQGFLSRLPLSSFLHERTNFQEAGGLSIKALGVASGSWLPHFLFASTTTAQLSQPFFASLWWDVRALIFSLVVGSSALISTRGPGDTRDWMESICPLTSSHSKTLDSISLPRWFHGGVELENSETLFTFPGPAQQVGYDSFLEWDKEGSRPYDSPLALQTWPQRDRTQQTTHRTTHHFTLFPFWEILT